MAVPLKERARPVESAPKYCPIQGPAPAPGKRFPCPGSQGSVCLSACLSWPLSVSVISRMGAPGGLEASATVAGGQCALSHVPLCKGRQERPPARGFLLQRLLTDGPVGSRVGISSGSVGVALDDNSLVIPLEPPWEAAHLMPLLHPLCPPPKNPPTPMFLLRFRVLKPRKRLFQRV